ncbi:MAG: HAD-IA family hydrolase [Candidatus Yanofskybacteria bacterium]|nr:HAD-IA family hydrolase [Candidatus Yanofskybacteria bacterium]
MEDIKVIVFDFFGVVVNNFPQQTGEALLNKYSINKEEWGIFVNKAAVGLDTGEKEESQFIDDIVAYFNLHCTAKDLEKDLNSWDDEFLIVNNELINLIKNLKDKYEIACFSNVSEALSARMNARGLYDVFDKVFLSYQIGKTKKDAEAWKYVEGELGHKPEEYLFIDDSEQNVETAEVRGWRAMQYKDDKKVEEKLRLLL